MASYPSSAKTYTTKATDDSIEASHVNALQDEVTALETALLGSLAHDIKFTDATYDIGKSGATRPRDGFFSRNVVIGGTLGVTGVATFTAVPVFSAGLPTLAQNLIFTDATYDIGATGATRPRDLFLSRNLTVGGTIVPTGDVYTTAWTDYTGSSTIIGWAATPSPHIIRYKKIGKLVFIWYHIEGTSNSASTSFTVPVAAATVAGFVTHGTMGRIYDNGIRMEVGASSLPSASSTVTLLRLVNGVDTAWTATGDKWAAGQFCYEAAS